MAPHLNLISRILLQTPPAAYVLGVRHVPEYAPSPKTECRGYKCEENVNGVVHKVRPFHDDAPDMRQEEQTKDRSGGHDVRFL